MPHQTHQSWKAPARIRTDFAHALSALYQQEVPLYGELLVRVRESNQVFLQSAGVHQPVGNRQQPVAGLAEVRHGAIRLGSAKELETMRRLFAVMGMHPVDYYDLGAAGIPVHSTAFRSLARAELQASPFRVFTSLLRLELIESPALRQQARHLIQQRQIFSPALLSLITSYEQQGGLTAAQARDFVSAALDTFRWQPQARVDKAVYQQLHAAHGLIADVVSFKGPHINHLTPNSLDIDHAWQAMQAGGLPMKAIIEGPPARKQAILLRQTSFKALSEATLFSEGEPGRHTARFGEIEQRGMALTQQGRALYDRLLDEVRAQVPNPEQEPTLYREVLGQVFKAFPDDLTTLRKKKLAYFEYHWRQPLSVSDSAAWLESVLTRSAMTEHSVEQYSKQLTEQLEYGIEQGWVEALPLTYEDFLPVSAAGIFRSNLATEQVSGVTAPALEQFEAALGCSVHDSFQWYEHIQQASIQQLSQQLHALLKAQQ